MTTPAFVQKQTGSTISATNSQTLAFGSVLTLGTHRFVTLRVSGASNVVSACAGSVSGAYTLLTSLADASSGMRLYLFYKEAGGAGAETVTVTTSVTNVSMRWGLLEYSGLLAAASLDVSASNTFTTTTAPATSAITTTVDGDLVLAVIATLADATTIVPGGTETSRFTDGISGNRFEAQDFLKATHGSSTSSWTLGATQPGVYIIASFKADTASAPSVVYPQYITRRNKLRRF